MKKSTFVQITPKGNNTKYTSKIATGAVNPSEIMVKSYHYERYLFIITGDNTFPSSILRSNYTVSNVRFNNTATVL